MTPPPTPPKSNRGLLIVAVVVVVVLVIAGIAVVAYLGSRSLNSNPSNGNGNNNTVPRPVQIVEITAINFDFTGGCWTSSTGQGGTVNAGSTFSTTWTMSNPSGLFQPTCTINSVSVSTPGFSISSDNVPVVVSPGGTQTLTVVLGTPSVAYTGVVQLQGTVSTT